MSFATGRRRLPRRLDAGIGGGGGGTRKQLPGILELIQGSLTGVYGLFNYDCPKHSLGKQYEGSYYGSGSHIKFAGSLGTE